MQTPPTIDGAAGLRANGGGALGEPTIAIRIDETGASVFEKPTRKNSRRPST